MLVLSFVIISMALTALETGERTVNKDTMKDLIVHYFSTGYKNKEILASVTAVCSGLVW
jgi:hypothetical protein